MLSDFHMSFTIDEIVFVMYITHNKNKQVIILELHDCENKIVIHSAFHVKNVLNKIIIGLTSKSTSNYKEIDFVIADNGYLHICEDCKQLVLAKKFHDEYVRYIKKLLGVIDN